MVEPGLDYILRTLCADVTCDVYLLGNNNAFSQYCNNIARYIIPGFNAEVTGETLVGSADSMDAVVASIKAALPYGGIIAESLQDHVAFLQAFRAAGEWTTCSRLA